MKHTKLTMLSSSAAGAVFALISVNAISQAGTTDIPSRGEKFDPVESHILSPAPVMKSADYFPGVLGQALVDIDNDGDLDVFVTNAEGYSNYLYLNDGNGQFHDVAEAAGVAMVDSNTTSVGVGDFDNDGLLDIMVGRQTNSAGDPAHPVLLKNLGSAGKKRVPKFVDISNEVGLTQLPESFRALGFAVADFDSNGTLDVFMGAFDLTNSDDTGRPIGTDDPNILLMNYRKGYQKIKFVDVTDYAGVAGVPVTGRTPETADQTRRPHTWVTYATDLNADSHMDLMVLNEAPGIVETYLNDGKGKFTLIENSDLTNAGGWMGISSADYDKDGQLDYFISNFGPEIIKLGPPPVVNVGAVIAEGGSTSALLLKGSPDGQLRDVAKTTSITPSSVFPPLGLGQFEGLSAYEFGWGATFFDADNDGYDDLYWVGSQWEGLPMNGIGRFLKNNQDQTFTDLTAEANLFNIPAGDAIDFSNSHNGYSVLSGDIDGDGDSDLVVINGSDSAAESAGAGIRVFKNLHGNLNRQLAVSLRSWRGNKFGVGAKVEVLLADKEEMADFLESKPRKRAITRFIKNNVADRFIKEIVTTTSAFSATQPMATFGLGDYDQYALVKVTWPNKHVSYRLVDENKSRLVVYK